jgi:SPOR domain
VTSAAPPTPLIFDWEVAGRELGASLDRLNAIAVLGTDEIQVAQVALGIGRQQARRRRVAIGDLLGDATPLTALVSSEDSHGLSDVFEYGLSLDRVARRAEGEGDLYILPTGAFISDHAEIMANRRWTKLAAGFKEEKALLIVAANAAAPGVETLVMQLDGAILVGETVPSRLPVARVLGAVRGPNAEPLPEGRVERRARPKYVVRTHVSLWKVGASFGVTLAALIAALGLWLTYRPFAQSEWAPRWLRGPAASADSLLLMIRGFDTAGVADSNSTLATARHLGLLTALDSNSRAPYGIAIVTFNTQAGALLELGRNSATFRAGTFTPVLIRETTWYRVVAGAYPDSASAAALLDTLRMQGTSDAGRAVIEPFPYALLVERDIPDTEVAARVAVYQRRKLPVYALLQADGTARLFAGAFKEPDEATVLHDAMRSAGIQTSLVYRTGRVY